MTDWNILKTFIFSIEICFTVIQFCLFMVHVMCLLIHLCSCSWMLATWQLEGAYLVLSFSYVGPEGGTQIVRVGSKHLWISHQYGTVIFYYFKITTEELAFFFSLLWALFRNTYIILLNILDVLHTEICINFMIKYVQ